MNGQAGSNPGSNRRNTAVGLLIGMMFGGLVDI
jgi:hypothetical protein